MREKILFNSQTFFVFVLCSKRRCSQIEPQLKVEGEDGHEAPYKPRNLKKILRWFYSLLQAFSFIPNTYLIYITVCLQTINIKTAEPIKSNCGNTNEFKKAFGLTKSNHFAQKMLKNGDLKSNIYKINCYLEAL